MTVDLLPIPSFMGQFLTSISMRRLVLAAALGLAACAEPSNENVSPVGPTTTEPRASSSTTTSEAPKGPVEVARFTGSEDTDTANFTVAESWELHWKRTGDGSMSVSWYEPGKAYPEDLVSIRSAEGKSLVRGGGTFYLSISTYGAQGFEVWVVDVPN